MVGAVTATPLLESLSEVVRRASLMHGWIPLGIQALTVAALIAAVGWRSRRWRLVWLPLATTVGVLVATAAHWGLQTYGLASEPAPQQLWLWVALTGLAAVTAVAGWGGIGWFRRNLSVFAASLCLLSTGLTVNGWIGYFPTVWTAYNQLTGGRLPGQVTWPEISAMQRRAGGLRGGALLPVTISAEKSGFPHRPELVYLPPAWFTSTPPPALPAVMMIGGEFNTPADWVRAGDAVATLDVFSARHGGFSPVIVFADSAGSFGNDTECVNGARGNAADHLTKDVVPYVNTSFGVNAQPAAWGVAGFSSGGTCALDLAVMRPGIFGAFLDIAGDVGPNAGTTARSIDRLFGGDATAWSAFDPATVIARHGPYADLSGLFVMPDRPDAAKDAETLCALAGAAAVTCSVVTLPGRHDWPFGASAFAASLAWLAANLDTPGVPPTSPPPSIT